MLLCRARRCHWNKCALDVVMQLQQYDAEGAVLWPSSVKNALLLTTSTHIAEEWKVRTVCIYLIWGSASGYSVLQRNWVFNPPFQSVLRSPTGFSILRGS